MYNHLMQSSELQSSNTKFRLFEQQYIMHSKASSILLSTFQSIKTIELQRCSFYQKLLPTLDSVQSVFYKGLAAKLATYLDTVIFQIEHMVKDYEENLDQYHKLKSMVESRFTNLMREFKKKRADTAESLRTLCETVVKSNSQPSRQNINLYNKCLTRYNTANDELIGFRKEYQARMMSEANDQIMKFFVLQLEKLRNNQFDIDQILKKSDESQSEFKLAKINEHVLWQFIEIGPLEQRISTVYGMNELNQIVTTLWKNKIPQTSQIFELFSEKLYPATLHKLPTLLKTNSYRQLLIPTFLTFHHQKLVIKDQVFKMIYQLIKIILEYSLSILQWDLLETSLVFTSAICTQRIISYDKNLQLCEIVCLLDYVKMLDSFREDKMEEVYAEVMRKQEGGEKKQKQAERCRKVARRLGIVVGEGKKKKIFDKSGSNNSTLNSM